MTSSKKSKQSPPIPANADIEPFSWLEPELCTDQAAQCIAFTLDMCQGIRKCLSALHANAIVQEHGDPNCPPLNAFDIDVMLRWAMASADAVLEKAEACIDDLNLKARQRQA